MLKLLVIGHLGRDASMNTVNGKNVINFPVAHSDRYKDAQGVQVERTTWVDCAYWTDRVAIAPYLKKGTQVYVEGTPDVRSYTTNDGRNGVTLTMRVMNIQLIGAKNADGTDAAHHVAQPQAVSSPGIQSMPAHVTPAASVSDATDDLPF